MDERLTDAHGSSVRRRLRLPGRPTGDLAARRSSSARPRPARSRVCVAEGLATRARVRRARRTTATSSSCCRSAAASTGCRPSCPPATPTTRRGARTSASRRARCIQLDAMFGMHPAMAPLKPFWDAGTFGVVHAVGRPQPNRSHFAAMEEMERAAPGTSMRTGWLDRVLGARATAGRRSRAMQLGSSMAAPRVPSAPRPSSRCGRSTRSGWTPPGTRSSALCGTRRSAACTRARPTRSRRRPHAALGALDTTAGAAGRPATRRRTGRLPGLRPRPRAAATSRGSSRPTSGCRSRPSTTATGTCTPGWAVVDNGWMHDHLTELSASLRRVRDRPRPEASRT